MLQIISVSSTDAIHFNGIKWILYVRNKFDFRCGYFHLVTWGYIIFVLDINSSENSQANYKFKFVRCVFNRRTAGIKFCNFCQLISDFNLPTLLLKDTYIDSRKIVALVQFEDNGYRCWYFTFFWYLMFLRDIACVSSTFSYHFSICWQLTYTLYLW